MSLSYEATGYADFRPESARNPARRTGDDTTVQKTMRALVAGDGSPYEADVLRRLDLTTDGAKWALRRLEATAEIEKTDGRRRVVDPLFAEWIAILNGGTFSS